MPGMTDRDHFAAAALTGLLGSREWPIDSEEAARYCYRVADAMLRERAKTNHDAAPEATANAESVAPQPTAGDRAGNPPSHSGTGDTPKPINDCVSDRSKPITGSDPDSRVWETHTPATHATHGEGSVRREGTEPAAWYVRDRAAGPPMLFWDEERAKKAAFACGVGARPLYLCQDFSRKNLTLTDAEREAVTELTDDPDFYGLTRTHTKVLRGLLERTGGGR